MHTALWFLAWLCALTGTRGSDFDILKPPPDPAAFVSAAVAAVFACATCKRCFKNGSGLASHYNSKKEHAPADFLTRHDRATPKSRKVRTYQWKRDRLFEYDTLARDPTCTDPMTRICQMHGIAMGTFNGWLDNRVEIFWLASTPGMSKRCKNRVNVKCQNPEAEHILYARFVWRRQYLRRRVNRKWLRRNMRLIIRAMGGNGGGSSGWCSRFCRRWEITYQGRTNKHTDSIQERLPLIRAFHQWLIYGLQRSEPQRCPKYGRFPPDRMYHMDQVPMPFSPGTKRTLNMRGEQCAIKEPGGESSTKRMCTLQVTICAEPSKQLPLEIIFRNAGGTDKHLTQDERDFYKALPNIRVRWQKSAWADEGIMTQYFRDFRMDTIADGEVLLGMDRHGSQKTALCRTFMEVMRIQPAFTPPNCTDCVSPVDHHIGNELKQMIAARYEHDYEMNEDAWHLPKREGGLGDVKKRTLVAKWASEAWEEFGTCPKKRHMVRQAFISTGFLIAKDGSENHLIKLARGKQFHGYTF